MILSNTQIIKECKAEARKYSLVFRQHKFSNLYCFHDRKTKEIILSNMTLGTVYNIICSGYISCYDSATRSFNNEQLHNLGLIQ